MHRGNISDAPDATGRVILPLACALAFVGIAMQLAATSMMHRGAEPVATTIRYGRRVLKPDEFWSGGPHYTAPPHKPVPREAWEPGKPFVEWLVQRRHRSPIILTNTLASRWRASKRWSPEYLSEHLPDTFLAARSSTHPVFQYYNRELSSKTAALHGDYLVDPEHNRAPAAPVLENMTMAEFCAQPQPSSPRFITHSFAYDPDAFAGSQGAA